VFEHKSPFVPGLGHHSRKGFCGWFLREKFFVRNFLVEMVFFWTMSGMITVEDENFMRRAIEKTRQGILTGQTPFGACIVASDGRVVACEHNSVWGTTDITAHGEVNAIRAACLLIRGIDLSGCTIYSTTEPCPMCFSAIHWSKVRRIVFGASIADARAAGFNELDISTEAMRQAGKSPLIVEGGCLRDECAGLFREWKISGRSQVY
jgi:tRNA(Arg) A34 adenosine deaminase TadA